MAVRLSTADPGFEAAFRALVVARRGLEADVDAAVAAIIAEVRAQGDSALIEYTRRFDRLSLTPAELRLGEAEIEAAAAGVDRQTRAALDLAARRIEDYHRRQMPQDERWRDAEGVELGWRFTPVGAVGLYVPGGTAAYPSTVLMNAIPARVAGVPRLAMTVPAPDGRLNPLVLAAAKVAGVLEIYRIGGAQAIAALAFGTATIAPVDKIVGPGNVYVAAAKRRVFGTVGIDMIAGPSEVVVIADSGNDPAWIAADLLSQAEHDEAAQAVLITDDPAFADCVVAALEVQIAGLARADIARASWEKHGAVLLVRRLDEAPELVDRLAPEHLEIAAADPEPLAAKVRNAGAIFLGRFTPEALGDYVGGPNHVLPTARSARFSSGLGVADFLKRTALLACDQRAAAALGPAVIRLAEAEGLPAHALSMRLRLGRRPTEKA
ncbi:MAG: histidinol dehydrogenase [Proteobacteria bacterium]|nr:histidinol dehydrogenase [Pseudomonadota bacterium]